MKVPLRRASPVLTTVIDAIRTSCTGPTFRMSGMEFLRNFFCIVYNRLAFTGRFGINEVLGFFLPGS